MKTQKIGITFSSFDLLHAGHIKMLEEALRTTWQWQKYLESQK